MRRVKRNYVACVLCHAVAAVPRLGFCPPCQARRATLPETPCLRCLQPFNHHVAARGGKRTGYYLKHCNVCARTMVMHARRHRQRTNKHWTVEEEKKLFRLNELGRTHAAMAKILKRTRGAIRGKLHEVFQSTRRSQYIGTREIQQMLGVSYLLRVTNWFQKGYFAKAKRIHERKWHIAYDDFLEWMADRNYWMLWNIEDITDPDLIKHAIEVREKVGGYWLRIRDVKDMTSYSEPTIARATQGKELPSVYRDHCSWYWIEDVKRWAETHDDLMYERRYKKPRPK